MVLMKVTMIADEDTRQTGNFVRPTFKYLRGLGASKAKIDLESP
jgi:hypothetical protein